MLKMHYAFSPPMKGVIGGMGLLARFSCLALSARWPPVRLPAQVVLRHHEDSVTTGNARSIINIDYHSV